MAAIRPSREPLADLRRLPAGLASVHAAMARAAGRASGAPFLRIVASTARHYDIAAGDIGYGQAWRRIEALRAAFDRAGYGTGQRVGLLLENRPDFFFAWIALNGLGVSVVPLHRDARTAELQYLIEHSEMVAAVAIDERIALLEDSARRANRVLPVIRAAALAADAPIPAPASPATRPGAAPGIDTECALLYTSGTTGRPKGCVLANEYFLVAGHWYGTIGGLCEVEPGREVLLTPLPMTHMNAMACSTMAMLLSGGCIAPLDRFHPGSWWDSVRESQATIVHYLGVMPAMLLAADTPGGRASCGLNGAATAEPAAGVADRNTAHRVRFGFGAGVDKRQHAGFEQRFGFPLIEAWAMTETGNGAVVIANHEPRHVGSACFGRAEPEVAVRIVADDGRDAGDDEPGELLVRSAGENPRFGFFRRYLKDAAATDAAWAGGWFHTGDIVRRDADGYMYFVDRKKNVIRRSGENIAALEVESVLRRHPAVREVAVAATPDPVRGDEVLACIVTHDALDDAAQAQLARQLVTHALDQLAYFKAPGWVAFVDTLPLTASQKIQRGELKEMARALPGSARCFDTRAMKRRRDD